ncbi:MAG: GNAT family N-acetyltransferase [Notoacmeibacter sp.]|nr:GNAT family N-acetyltransferase [Notoacmeibacter sp.]
MRLKPDFDFSGGEYRALFARAGATAFQHPLWLTNFYGRLVPARGGEAAVLTGYDASGTLVFVLPMVLRSINRLRVLETADLGVSDYCAPVVCPDWLERQGPAAGDLAPFADHLPQHAILRIGKIRPEHLDLWRLFFPYQPIRSPYSAHETQLRPDYAAWRAQALTKQFTKYLDRRRRRFFKAGDAKLELVSQPDEIADAVSEIARLRAGRFEGDPIQEDFVREFYASIAVEGAPEGFARIWRLTLDGEAIGHVFGTAHAGRFCYLLIGCDYERHGRHSPGLVLYDTIIERWIGEGGDVFDFTIGDEAFKADFGTTAVAIHHIQHATGAIGRLGLAALGVRDRFAGLRKTD